MTSTDLEGLVSRLEDASKDLENCENDQITSVARERIRVAIEKVNRKLQTPTFDPTLWQVVFGVCAFTVTFRLAKFLRSLSKTGCDLDANVQAQAQAAFRLAYRMKIFQAFRGDNSPTSIDELAAKAGADTVLTGKFRGGFFGPRQRQQH